MRTGTAPSDQPLRPTIEYAGFTIKYSERCGAVPCQPGWIFLDENRNYVVPGASYFKSAAEAMRGVDVFLVADRDAQKFWHLWYATHGHNRQSWDVDMTAEQKVKTERPPSMDDWPPAEIKASIDKGRRDALYRRQHWDELSELEKHRILAERVSEFWGETGEGSYATISKLLAWSLEATGLRPT